MAQSFEMGEKALVTDPCYTLALSDCRAELRVRPGRWKAAIEQLESRCDRLIAWHSDFSQPTNWDHFSSRILVDSGQVGIFTKEKYPQGDTTGDSGDQTSFYGRACAATGSADCFDFIEEGVVSTTAYGDGRYDCYVHIKNGDVVGIMVDYVGTEEDTDCPQCGGETDYNDECTDESCSYCPDYVEDDEEDED